MRLKSTNHRKAGDAHRAAGEWPQAAAEYKRHLADNPGDAAIWVQYAHASKEAGDLVSAEKGYRTATEIRPDDADAWIHLGHLLKRLSKFAPAAAAFSEAIRLGFDDSLDSEIMRLRRDLDQQPASELKPDTILFAIQDLLIFLSHYVTMSGIQRVQCGIADHIIDMADVESRFIITDQSGVLEDGSYWEVDKTQLRGIINYASGEKVEHAELKRLVTRCEETATVVKPGKGHIIVLLGCFWAHDNTADKFIPAKRNGVIFGSYIYDIIPISHPEFCEIGLVKMFGQGLSEMCLIADFFLTISDYTRVTLENFLKSHGARVVPMMTVPLAHSLTGAEHKSSSWPTALQKIRGGEYVAYVSTIEGRKNHIYVVNAWRELIAQGKRVPDLVFVGRRGWRVNGLIDYLEGTNYLDGRVHFVHDLSDGELNAVYEHSLFTVFTSLVEGWGLPVGESLLHNRLCVASSTTSVPEVGGDFVEYVDPTDIRDGIAKFGRLIEDRAYLAQRQKNIEDNFVPRGWDEVARMFVDRTRELAARPLTEMPAVPLRQGELFRPGDLSRIPLRSNGYNPEARRLIMASSFFSPETWGAWMRGRNGEIEFGTDLPEGAEVLVFLELKEAGWERNGSFSVFIADPMRRSGQTPIPITVGKTEHRLQVRGVVGRNGVVRVLFEINGHYNIGDVRDFLLGLVGVGYAAPDNIAARAELFEAFMFLSVSETIKEGSEIDPGRVSAPVRAISMEGLT